MYEPGDVEAAQRGGTQGGGPYHVGKGGPPHPRMLQPAYQPWVV